MRNTGSGFAGNVALRSHTFDRAPSPRRNCRDLGWPGSILILFPKLAFFAVLLMAFLATQQAAAQYSYGSSAKAFAVTGQSGSTGVHLVQGYNYPICQAIISALRKMPPSTELTTWPRQLAAIIRGVEEPRWSALDASQHLPELRTFLLARLRPGWIAGPEADDATWAGLAGAAEQRIASGEIRMEETIVRSVKLGVPSQVATVPEWVSNVRFVRVGLADRSVGTIRLTDLSAALQRRPTITSWGYMAVSFSAFPFVRDVVVGNGSTGFEMVLVDDQPWFVGTNGVVATPYTSDLGLSGVNVTHSVALDQKCLIHFPTRLPNGTIR